jgi:V/A-type H+-transporting ATPase subunit D
MAALRIPPGRAGRLWLRERLELAGSALALLEQKRAILEQEYRRLRTAAEDTARDWDTACRTARTWQLRATLLGGQRCLVLAAARQPAGITVTTAALAGLRYPDTVDCTLPQSNSETMTPSSAVAQARTAHAAAVGAAAQHAVTLAAVRAVEHELTATRLRAQALRHRRIPALRAALAQLELSLEERERAERILLQRAAPESPLPPRRRAPYDG